MNNQEIAHQAWQDASPGMLILEDDARIRFEAVSSYRDENGDFAITLETDDGEKAYHSSQIKEIRLDQSTRTESPRP